MPSPTGADRPPATTPPDGVSALLLRCTRDLLLWVDADATLRWCNPALERLLGRDLTQLAGLAWPDALPVAPADRPALDGLAASLARHPPSGVSEQIGEIEIEVIPAAAAPAWLRIAAQPLPGDATQPPGAIQWLIVMQDITPARQSEREARRLAELLGMAQESGRIGFWERGIPSGVGRIQSQWEVRNSPTGEPCRAIGIPIDDSDVSEQADERRRTTALMQRMEAAAAAAGVGIWSYDAVTDEAQWNEPMFALVGRSPLLGAPSRKEWDEQVIHPADRDRMRAERAALDARPGEPGEQRYRVALPGGEVRWLENRVRRETLDGHLTILGVTLDITERRQAEDALRSADERAALAARGAGIGTWAIDFVGDNEHWDEQMYRLRGIEPRARAPGRAERLALLHPDDTQNVFDSRPDAATTDRLPAQYEFRVRWPDGGYRWLASRSSVVVDQAGRPLRRIGVNWDITEARLAEAAREQGALAQRENLAKSRFLSRVSHELRTPLNAVIGFAQLVQAEAELAPAQRARLGWIRSAGEHLLLLIDDVLDLSGLEIGDLKLVPQAVPLAELVRETVPLVEPLAAQHGVALAVGATGGVALADRTRLRQVLINLLSNGIKYNRAQGRVSVTTASGTGRVTLQVSDSGRGLAPEQMAHLFEPFNRLGAERDGIDGSGIGLVIVKALVERMGGTVQVSSQLGEGTRFSVDLPAADLAAQAAQPGPATIAELPLAAPAPLRPGRLLYIEDNPVNMLLVQELVALRPAIEFIGATTGAQGVQQAIAFRPALVLVDMQLPDFDGFEVLRRLRADPRTAGLHCVALSANALPDDIARALAAGFVEYWTKPIHFGGFLAALDTMFAADPA